MAEGRGVLIHEAAHEHEAAEGTEEQLGVATLVSFHVNYVMGVGFLALPWAFHQAGIGLGIVLLLFITALNLVSAVYLLEAISRSEALARRSKEITEMSASPLLPVGLNRPKFEISTRKWEIVEMMEIYLGHWARGAYCFLICIYLYGTQWAYGSVFASALAGHIAIPGVNGGVTCNVESGGEITASCFELYRLYLLIFVVVAMVLACMEIKEQATFQLILSFFRVTMVITMVLTCLISWSSHDYTLFGTDEATAPHPGFGKLFNFANIAKLFGIVMYSQIFHTGIPVLIVPARDKLKMPKVYALTYLSTTIVYGLGSSVVAAFFGPNTARSANINWTQYGDVVGGGATARFAKVMGTMVVLFPAFDVISVCPITAISLASNIMGAIYGSKRVVEMEKRRIVRIGYRMLALVPPMVGAVFVPDLSTIFSYTGVVGLVIAFIVPPLLWEFSARRMRQEFMGEGRLITTAHDQTDTSSISSKPRNRSSNNLQDLLTEKDLQTPYHYPWSNHNCVRALLVFGCFTVVGSLTMTIAKVG